jgi:hypothetical protein
MMDLSSFGHYSPVFILVILVVLIYGGLKLLKIPGNDFVLVLTSILISFVFVSSNNAVNYMANLIPVLTVLMLVGFIIVLTLVFVAKDLEPFKKILAWTGFILAILFCLGLAFGSFHTLNHLLPDSSDSGLSPALNDLKDFIYDDEFKDGFVFVVCIALVSFLLLKKAD